MASRNKKGRLYNLFSTNFNVTFFYKPGSEESGYYGDEFYYIVLNDLIFIKARFIDNAVLMIDSATSMTISIINKLYDELVKYLKTVDDITIFASCIGSGMEFIQACKANDVPAVECPEFLGYSEKFYHKYKCYARNDISLYGYYLLALHEESYTKVKNRPSKIQLLDDGFVPELDEPDSCTTPTDESVGNQAKSLPEITQVSTIEEKSSGRPKKFDDFIDMLMNKLQGVSMTEKDGPLIISMSAPNISFTITGTHYVRNEGTSYEVTVDDFCITELSGNCMECFKLVNIMHDCIALNPTKDDIEHGSKRPIFVKCFIANVNTSGIDNNVFPAIDGNPYCKVSSRDNIGGNCTYEII